MKRKIIIAGGTGFLGKILSDHFKINGDEVIIYTRGRDQILDGITYVHWDAKTEDQWTTHLENADVLINLVGKSVDCRYTEENKKAILNSRVDATTVLGKAIKNCNNPPSIWMNSSTATIYKYSLHQLMDEDTGDIGDDFSMNVAKAWERSFFQSETPDTRKIALRISLVLGHDGGVVPVLKNLVKFGLGGHQGDGKQKFAWIHQKDIVGIVEFCIKNKNLEGPINCAAVSDITNHDFMKAFRKAMDFPFGIPNPKIMIHIGAFFMRTAPELILKSRYVTPKRLLDSGYKFAYNDIQKALNNILTKS